MVMSLLFATIFIQVKWGLKRIKIAYTLYYYFIECTGNTKMKAMILAAGRGERMRPLTDTCPKPLLKVGEESLIGWHLCRLKAAGFNEIVINHAWLGQQIEDELKDGAAYGVQIHYSAEGESGLETAGGITTALPLLGDEPFLVINGDVLTDIDFQAAFVIANEMKENNSLAYLWLVDNPEHNPKGDFGLDENQGIHAEAYQEQAYTFSGMGIYHPTLFADIQPQTKAKLAPLLRQAMMNKQVQGQLHSGVWIDVGTVERLQMANDWVKHHAL